MKVDFPVPALKRSRVLEAWWVCRTVERGRQWFWSTAGLVIYVGLTARCSVSECLATISGRSKSR